MKKLLLVLLSFVSLILGASEIPKGWETDIAKAKKRAAAERKPILILVSGPEWCGPCAALDRNVISDKTFSRLALKNAVCLYVHSPKNDTAEYKRKKNILRKVFSTGGVPRYAVTDAKLNPINKPAERTVYHFIKAISDARVKKGAEPILGLKRLQREYEMDKRRKDKADRKMQRKQKRKR